MSRRYADRVLETSASTGTGDIALAGAVTGYQRFDASLAVGDTCDYAIVAVDANGAPTGDWETGQGTYSAADTLSRTTVQESSNGNQAVNFAGGSLRVMLSANAASLLSAIVGSTAYIRHRAWRLRTTSTLNGQPIPGLAELQFHNVVGGASICQGGTPIADSGNAALAFDGDIHTNWEGNAVPAWVGYDFGEANPVYVLEMQVTAHDQFEHRTFNSGFVEWSDDLVTWHEAWEIDGQSWNVDEVRNFVNPSPQTASTEVPPGGDAGQVLTKKTGTDYDLEWADQGAGGGAVFQGASLTRNSDFAAPSADTSCVVPFDVASFDVGGFFDSAHPERLTVPSGAARVSVMAQAARGNSTSRYGAMFLTQYGSDGTQKDAYQVITPDNTGQLDWMQVVTGPVDVASGDYFTMAVQVGDNSQSFYASGLKFKIVVLDSVTAVSEATSGGDVNNGWRKTSDGFIEQWGQASGDGSTVTFPIPFTEGVSGVHGNAINFNNSDNRTGLTFNVNNVTLQNFLMRVSYQSGATGGSGAPSETFAWRAWGR